MTPKKTTNVLSKVTLSNLRAPANKAPAALSGSIESGAQVSAVSQKTTSKHKVQPNLESELAHEPENPAVEPPAKKQKANTQVKRKDKATNCSNSWARKCQEEVAQLESANMNVKKKPATSAGLSNAIPGTSSSSSASALTLDVPLTNQVKPPHCPRARPPPKDAPAEMTLAIKQEMVDLFDLKSASVPHREM
ncbi:hypothetical protein BN14_07956 [Rhizoctonia solani AG-1 IB]|uniref:Uncharacterized protein n=1 Tax=Thanatephorus cucumeris (strain AG1-IB / isolate 7/3/14) TaxID=1108050 RepID=M5C495_THACB|nr:hypothetical protein BN14_07956 [Rhizoctonia solani AG-1 IB]